MFISKPRRLYTNPTLCEEDAEQHLDAVAKIAANTSRNDLTTQMTSTSTSTNPMSDTTTAEPLMQQEWWKEVNHDELRDEWEISSLWRMRKKSTPDDITQTSLLVPYSNGYIPKKINKKQYSVHVLMALTFVPNPEGLPTVDHIDRNTRNNHIWNLRWASHSQQQANKGLRNIVKSSQFKGVTWDSKRELWCACVTREGKRYKLGRYEDEAQAALQYNKRALELFGEFAVLNPVDPSIELIKPHKPRVKTSRYRGVSWSKSKERWKAYIVVDTKQKYIGQFQDDDDAAIAYNDMVLKLFGSKAVLNVID